MSGNVVRLVPRGDRKGPASRQGAGSRPDDAELLSRVARGDVAAHRVIFDRYFARVMAFVRRRVRDEGLCEEIVQDVFFEVWRSADAFRGDAEVHSWIFGIAHFKALSARRHRGQMKRARVTAVETRTLERFPGLDDPEGRVGSREEVQRLLRAFALLPEGQSEVLRMAFLEGASYAEIAERLDISEGNVKTRVNRARARLRTLVQRSGDTAPGGGTR